MDEDHSKQELEIRNSLQRGAASILIPLFHSYSRCLLQRRRSKANGDRPSASTCMKGLPIPGLDEEAGNCEFGEPRDSIHEAGGDRHLREWCPRRCQVIMAGGLLQGIG